MKFVIDKSDLVDLLGKIQNVVALKATIPILSNFLLEVDRGGLILTSTDLTVGVRCYAKAKIFSEGATTIPAKRFFQLIRELTNQNIEISVDENEVTHVKAGTSEFKLNGMNKSEFPVLPDLDGASKFKIKQSVLKDMFFRSSFAVSKEDNRYVLTGVLLQVIGDQVTFVGSDGKRLAKSYSIIKGDEHLLDGDYILPLKAVDEINKSLNSEEGTATIYLMRDKVAVETETTFVISKLLNGDYPDFNRVIPQDLHIEISLHREELITLLRQVSLFTNENTQSVKFSFVDGELCLTVNSSELGEGKVNMPANYQGELFQIAFNPTYFLDILRHCRGETVILKVTDSYNPGLIYDTESEEALFVIMPMRLSEG